MDQQTETFRESGFSKRPRSAYLLARLDGDVLLKHKEGIGFRFVT